MRTERIEQRLVRVVALACALVLGSGSAVSASDAGDGGMARTVAAVEVVVPDVTVVDMDGHEATLDDVLGVQEPLMLNFIFTTCGTICPVMSATFARVQAELKGSERPVRLVSVSIDPAHDTPEKLRQYAARMGARPGWRLVTGRLDDIIAIEKAFGAWDGSKFSHRPLTFMRPSAGAGWARVDGLLSAEELIATMRSLESGS